MVDKIKDTAERNSGILVGIILIIQAILVPAQFVTIKALWTLSDRIAEQGKAGAASEEIHKQQSRDIEDHERRIRALEQGR